MFAVVAGVMVTYDPAQMHTVWPSAGAASVAWLAMTPPPPGRLSTMLGCFQSVASWSASTRPRTSPVLPGLAPVMKRTGFEGKSAAWSEPTKAQRAMNASFSMAALSRSWSHKKKIGEERGHGAGEHHRRHRHRTAAADPAHRRAGQHAERRLRRAQQRGGDAGALAEGRHRHRGGIRGDEADRADHDEDREEDAGEAQGFGRRKNQQHAAGGGQRVDAPAQHPPRAVARDHPAIDLRDGGEARGAGAEVPAELFGRNAEVLDVDERRGGKVGEERAEGGDEDDHRPEKAPIAEERRRAPERTEE